MEQVTISGHAVRKVIGSYFISVAVLILAVFLAPSPAISASAEDGRTGKAILVIADGVRLSDIDTEAFPEIKRMISQGAIGLMNTRSIGRGPDAPYITLGAGERGVAHAHGKEIPRSALALNTTEILAGNPAWDTFRARTEVDPPAQGLVQMFAYALAQENSAGQRGAVPGLLGGTLVREGFKVGVIGNSDRPEAPSRAAVLIGMTEQGIVTIGDVGRRTKQNVPVALGQRRTDSAYVQNRIDAFLPKVDLLIIESGDTRRISAESLSADPRVIATERRLAMARIDNIIGSLAGRLDRSKDRLFFISPSSPLDAEAHDNLTPLIMWGRGVTPGLISSPSTRRPGIATNMDIAPSVLDYFHVETPPNMAGRPLSSFAAKRPISFLENRQTEIYSTEVVRRPFIVAYVTASVAALLFSLAILLLGYKGLLAKLAIGSLLWSISIPLALLLSTTLQPLPPAFGFLAPIVLAAMAAAASYLAGRSVLTSLALIGAATAAAIVVDIVSGSNLNSGSILGYSMVAGSRFYGVGNEYMGVLLGAVIIGIGAVADRMRGRWAITATLIFLAGVLLVMALPFLGANVGGTIAVSAGFAYLAIRLTTSKFGFREALILCGVMAIALGLLFAVDFASQSTSHAAKVADAIVDDKQALGRIAARKLAMNYKLLRVTVWTEFLAAGIVSLGVLYYLRRDLLECFRAEHPQFSMSLFALFIGMAFAFAFNDSGVIAAAAAAIFGLGALFCCLLAPLASSETRA